MKNINALIKADLEEMLHQLPKIHTLESTKDAVADIEHAADDYLGLRVLYELFTSEDVSKDIDGFISRGAELGIDVRTSTEIWPHRRPHTYRSEMFSTSKIIATHRLAGKEFEISFPLDKDSVDVYAKGKVIDESGMRFREFRLCPSDLSDKYQLFVDARGDEKGISIRRRRKYD